MIPAERRIFIRTHELNGSHKRLSEFLGVPLESLDASGGHRNRSTWEGRLETMIDRSYIDEMVTEMGNHFPEISSFEDVDDLWNGRPTS